METPQPTSAATPTPQQRKPAKTKKKQKRGNRPTPTPQQKRFIDLFTKHALTGGTESIVQLLIKAGYSPDTARQQSNIMAGIRPHLDPFVDKMERHREMVMAELDNPNRVKGATYGELVRSMHTLTHNIRLLTGKSTQNFGILVEDRRQEINRLIDE